MKHIFTAILFLFSFYATAQLPAYNWAVQTQACPGNDYPNALVTDASGNSYITGAFVGSIDMDPGPGAVTLTAGNYQNAYIAKYDGSGNLLWANVLSATLQTEGLAIALDLSGNVVVTGFFVGTVDFDPGPGVQSMTNANTWDAFVAKYDTNGNYVWAFQLASSVNCTGIKADDAGNIWITGYMGGTTDFDPGPATQTLTGSSSSENTFLAKYSPSGAYLFAFLLTCVNGTGASMATAVTLTKAGSVAICGYFRDSTDFDPGPAAQISTNNGSNNNDAFVAQYDSSGNYQWHVSFGGYGTLPTANDNAVAICSDPFNNIIVTGYFLNIADFDPSSAVHTLVANGDRDAFLAKYDQNGGYVWAIKMGDTWGDGGTAVTADSTGTIFTTGLYTNTVDFDPGVGVTNLTTTTANINDIYVASYKANNGALRFAFPLAGGYNGAVSSGIEIRSAALYVTGRFGNTVDFDPGPPAAYLVDNSGGANTFLARYDDNVTGIDDETAAAPAVSIYADGVLEQINISLPGNSERVEIEIYNSSGALVAVNETASSSAVISAHGLSAGLYHCRITTAAGESLTRSFLFAR